MTFDCQFISLTRSPFNYLLAEIFYLLLKSQQKTIEPQPLPHRQYT